jgi:hypothetical protein
MAGRAARRKGGNRLAGRDAGEKISRWAAPLAVSDRAAGTQPALRQAVRKPRELFHIVEER